MNATEALKGLHMRRGFPLQHLRAVETDNELRVEGYAAVFDQETDLGWFREVIRPGAFAKTLREGNQVALWNHDTSQTLGRRGEGTLDLSEDDHGLRMKLSLDPQITEQRDAYLRIKRGDVKGMSFGFVPVKEAWTEADEEKNETKELRELVEVRLFEVSPVTFPAYEMTEVEARACETAGVTDSEPEVKTAANEPDHSDESEPDHSKALADTRAKEVSITLNLL